MTLSRREFFLEVFGLLCLFTVPPAPARSVDYEKFRGLLRKTLAYDRTMVEALLRALHSTPKVRLDDLEALA